MRRSRILIGPEIGAAMSRRFAELAFTPLVKEQQERHGSRRQYARMEEMGEPGDR